MKIGKLELNKKAFWKNMIWAFVLTPGILVSVILSIVRKNSAQLLFLIPLSLLITGFVLSAISVSRIENESEEKIILTTKGFEIMIFGGPMLICMGLFFIYNFFTIFFINDLVFGIFFCAVGALALFEGCVFIRSKYIFDKVQIVFIPPLGKKRCYEFNGIQKILYSETRLKIIIKEKKRYTFFIRKDKYHYGYVFDKRDVELLLKWATELQKETIYQEKIKLTGAQ